MGGPREASWIRRTIEAPAAAEDELAAALCALGALGVEVEGGPAEGSARVRLRAFFDEGAGAPGEEAIAALIGSIPGAAAAPGGSEIVPDGRWVERYVATLAPFDVGGRFTVTPIPDADEPGPATPASPGRLPIRICPGRAFGTGEHATTRLCLEAIEEEARPGRSVLDVGTGSGILAIAAALLGAGPVIGVDVDEEALRVAAINAALTPEASGIRFLHGGPQAAGRDRFDVVVANLNGVVLSELHAGILARVAPGGRLILSGLLDEEAEGIAAALEAAGARRIRIRRRSGWACTLHEAPRA